MNGTDIVSRIAVGIVAGVAGGMFGIGGGLVIVPVLILVFHLDRDSASGTSLLAQLLPVGILAVLEYGRRGQLQVATGLWIALGLLFGTLIGAKITGLIPPAQMKQAYGGFLILVGIYFAVAPGGVGVKKPVPAPVSQPTPDQPSDESKSS